MRADDASKEMYGVILGALNVVAAPAEHPVISFQTRKATDLEINELTNLLTELEH